MKTGTSWVSNTLKLSIHLYTLKFSMEVFQFSYFFSPFDWHPYQIQTLPKNCRTYILKKSQYQESENNDEWSIICGRLMSCILSQKFIIITFINLHHLVGCGGRTEKTWHPILRKTSQYYLSIKTTIFTKVKYTLLIYIVIKYQTTIPILLEVSCDTEGPRKGIIVPRSTTNCT